jgi:hypothetical protein
VLLGAGYGFSHPDIGDALQVALDRTATSR